MDAVFLPRERIDRKLQSLYQYPLSIVHAPIGYGKTAAVEAFLSDGRTEVVWVAFGGACVDGDEFWMRLTAQMAKNGLPLSEKLRGIGFPYDSLKTGKMLDVLIDYEYERPMVVVLDNFHQVEDSAVFSLLRRIALGHIPKLHLVVITRNFGALDAALLYQQGLCFTLTEKSLRFTKDEVRGVSALQRFEVKDDALEKIFALTDGWIAMVLLILDGMKRGLPIEKNDTVEQIIEQNIYSRLNEDAKDALLLMSYLDTFTEPMAIYALGESAADTVRALLGQKSIICYNELDKTYRIHNLLLGYLREKESWRQVDFRSLYSRLGQWHLKGGQYRTAFDCFLKAGDSARLLAELDQESAPELPMSMWKRLFGLFNGLDDATRLKYPVAFLRYIRVFSTSGEKGSTAQCWDHLVRMEELVQSSALERGLKKSLLGEIHVMWGYVAFNNLDEILIHSRKAIDYLAGGCSSIVNRRSAFTFGSPHFLHLHYNRAGQLSHTIETLKRQSHVITAVINDCGVGSDSVASAEYALETGDWDKVELNAYKAIYKASTAGQIFLILCANFALARLALLRGKTAECNSLMDSLKDDVLRENSPVLNTAYDLCMAYLACCMRRIEGVPAWVAEGDFSKGSFLFQGQSFYYVVHGKVLAIEGQPIHLDAYCETAVHRFERYNNQLGFLHNALHEAQAKSALGERTAAIQSMAQALSIGFADHVVLPFIESAMKKTEKKSLNDYKTMLQEIVQKNPQEVLGYLLVEESGPDHDKRFEVEVRLNSNVIGHGIGRSKKAAEQMAAKEALELMGQ